MSRQTRGRTGPPRTWAWSPSRRGLTTRSSPGGRDLDINTRTRNAIQRSLHRLSERGFALITQRWRTLQHVTASPSKIGDIARAALVLTHLEHGHIR